MSWYWREGFHFHKTFYSRLSGHISTVKVVHERVKRLSRWCSLLTWFPLKALLELERLPLFAVELRLIVSFLHLCVRSLSWQVEVSSRWYLSCMTQQKQAWEQTVSWTWSEKERRHRSLCTCAIFAAGSQWFPWFYRFEVHPQHLVHLSKCTQPQGKLRKQKC